MYRGFNLTSNNKFGIYKTIGEELYTKNKQTIKSSLDSFLMENGNLNGTEIQKNWFEQVKSDIFISHSHADKEMAIGLAGRLSNNLGLSVFIDSSIWGYANDLLRIIDNKYCLNEDKRTYNYDLRNESTAHVHLMLSTALSMMIDNSECLFFLNTPNSITTSSVIDKTNSPWIYSEIVTSSLVRKRKLSDYRGAKTLSFLKGGKLFEMKRVSIEYDVTLNHLLDLDYDDLVDWENKYKAEIPMEKYPLDKLYSLFPSSTLL